MNKSFHPGVLIRQRYIDPLGMSITEAADRLGITRQGLSCVLNGHYGLSARLAAKLDAIGWGNYMNWMAHQAQFDLQKLSERNGE